MVRGWLFRILLCFLLFVCVLYIQMADLEKEILRRGRAYQCLLCDRYQGEKRHVIPHIYKYHIPLDSAPYYCSLCHFIATEKKKLVDHVSHYVKHTEAAKDMADNGKSYLHENKDPILLVEGSHFAKMGRKESHDLWASRLRRTTVIPNLGFQPSNTTPSYPVVDVEPEPVRDVLRTPEPLLAAESVGAAAIPIMDDFLSCEPNLDFLDRILGYASPPKAAEILSIQGGMRAGKGDEKEEEKQERKEENREKEGKTKMDEEREGVKRDQKKRKRRDSSSTSSSDSGTSDSESEEEEERVKERKIQQQSQLKSTLIAKVDTLNNHLFMIHDVLHHMMGEMKRQTAVLQEIKDARQPEREEAVVKRRSRSPRPREPVPNRPRTPPRRWTPPRRRGWRK